MRWMYESQSRAMSKLTTCVTPLMSKPRAATSVATSMEHSRDTNLRSDASRSCCCLSPCTAQVEKPSCQNNLATKSTRRLVLAKMTTDAVSKSSEHRKLYSSLSFTSSWASMKVCLMALLATSSPSAVPSPMNISAVSSLLRMNLEATFRTALGQVAVKKRVCREDMGGRAAVICLSCGSNPMSSIRSASSSTTKWQSPNDKTGGVLRSRRSQRRPGVAITIRGLVRRNSCICWLAGVPPYTHAEDIPMGVPNLTHSLCICMASSRVGDTTRPIGEGTVLVVLVVLAAPAPFGRLLMEIR
mmetsp:Transcript_13031/g.27411  ORF Transcript_13031/g.27411 Transcript_13031/m.27411 type:complete len:300 (-) Transcript_13031:656-1555(-)